MADLESNVICGLQKILILGNCSDTDDDSCHMYAMLYNVQLKRADRFQILPNIQDSKQITAINYGPYDNGYLFLGLSSGHLLAFDILHGAKSKPKDTTQVELPGINQVLEIQLASSPITQIAFDPTQLVLVSVENSKHLYALTLIEKKFNYVYLDLGYSSFCTVKVDHNKNKNDLLKKVKLRRNNKTSQSVCVKSPHKQMF